MAKLIILNVSCSHGQMWYNAWLDMVIAQNVAIILICLVLIQAGFSCWKLDSLPLL